MGVTGKERGRKEKGMGVRGREGEGRREGGSGEDGKESMCGNYYNIPYQVHPLSCMLR